uniref:Partial AB-hydrolase lipase domain-containing protein n=1 Tax=Varanus komodoensis TaxID=61221 RepID=A0A8D2J3E3_VARKO
VNSTFGIIQYHNYPSEEYQVESKDGYLLTIVRIPHGRYNGANKDPRPVVFLQHAAFGDASHWISNLPNNSLGFILADAGYDVWLGNSRGNTWSRKHKTLSPKEKKFWEFSFHEMGYYDIPAILYFILNKTGQQQLYYVGHSEGAASGFVAFSTWPKLAERVKVFFALSPATTITYATSPLLKLSVFPPWMFHVVCGSKGILLYPTHLRKLLTTLCMYFPKYCVDMVSFVCGNNMPNLNMSRTDVFIAHSPAGSSVQNTLHWIQVFHAYDYGIKEKNMEKYNQTTPPVYQIEDIKTPVAIWAGGKDLIVQPKDVAMLRARIKNLIYTDYIPEWEHVDFIWGLDAAKRMYNHMIAIMKKY